MIYLLQYRKNKKRNRRCNWYWNFKSDYCSGKTGEGIDILEGIVKHLPAPKSSSNNKLRSLLVDSWYDSYLGVVILVRVIDGSIKKNMNIKFMSNNSSYNVEKVGTFTPEPNDIDELKPGEGGFIITGIKSSQRQSWNTICNNDDPITSPLPGLNLANQLFLRSLSNGQFWISKIKRRISEIKTQWCQFFIWTRSSSALGLGLDAVSLDYFI